MFGYHFTTAENFEKIQRTGLELYPLEVPDVIEEYTQDGGIWVFRQMLKGVSLLGQIIYVASHHRSNSILLLLVQYEQHQAASYRYHHDHPLNELNLIHSLEVPHFGHEDISYEILVTPVMFDRIRPICKWNMLDLVERGTVMANTPHERGREFTVRGSGNPVPLGDQIVKGLILPESVNGELGDLVECGRSQPFDRRFAP